MLLLLAALLCADAAPWIAEVPEPEEAERADDSAGRTAEASVRAAASTRGEGRAEISARASAGGVALAIGATESASVKAPQRQEIFLGIEAGAGPRRARGAPPPARRPRTAARLGGRCPNR